MKEYIEVETREEAWNKAKELFGVAFEFDVDATKNAGYKIYKALQIDNEYRGMCRPWISDLGNRIELNMANGDTINIHLKEQTYTPSQVRAIVAKSRKEIEQAERLLKFIDSMQDGDIVDEVLRMVTRRKNEFTKYLEDFGI